MIKKETRIYLVFVIIGVFALGIIIKMFAVQFAEPSEWKEMAENFVTEYRDIEANRGNIYAEDGSLLATTLPHYEIRMDLTVESLTDEIFNQNIDSLAYGLADLFLEKGNTAEYYKRRLIDERKSGNKYCLVQKAVDYNQVQEAKKLPIFRKGRFKGGVIFEKENKRIYPFGVLASRTIGYYRDSVNKVGLEGSFGSLLGGVDGKRLERRIVGGQWIPVGDGNDVEPVDGVDIYTTIDINIQDVAESALLKQLEENDAQYGTVILMEVETGFVKAIANLERNKDGKYGESYNHAVGSATEPGSTFKLASVLALLEEGVAKVTDTVDTKNGRMKFYDRVMRDSNGKGYAKISLGEALEKSSNVGISYLVNEGFKNNPQQFVDRLYSMGLGHSLGVSIKGEPVPYIKNTSDKSWSGVSLPWMSIGYEVTLTPLQILAFYNAIANDGKLLRPQFVSKIEKDGELIKQMEPIVLNESIASKNSINQVKKLLENVVLKGTAKNLKNSSFNIAGKTGTAQIATNGKYSNDGVKSHQASFVGYFPAENPKYSCMVLVSAPGKDIYYGNQVAGPIFKETAEKIYAKNFAIQSDFERNIPETKTKIPVSKNGNQNDLNAVFAALNVPVKSHYPEASWVATTTGEQKVETNRINIKKDRVPNVVGMGLVDALYLLENAGLSVKTSGRGTVKSQSMTAGDHFEVGSKITIELNP
ncbi:MAG: cell division protein FtsI (penicillin-binding protein 3) [Patiriisocius sp.]